MRDVDVASVMSGIRSLPAAWHGHGSLTPLVLERILHHVGSRRLTRSMETGTGKSTLLLSHLSDHHYVFTFEDPKEGSLEVVRKSALLRAEAVEFVLGPTQRTLRQFELPDGIELALIDGPHAYPFPELEYYAVYPHLAPGALLIIDDIHIPTVNHLFQVLREDSMFEELEVTRSTAFLRRTNAPIFDPEGEGWNRQLYNTRRFPTFRSTRGFTPVERVKARIPERVRRALRKFVPRNPP